MISNVFYTVISIVFGALATFAIAQWLHLPVGSFTDWLIGGAIFVWLVIVVTVPWDIYFKAKQVLGDAELSQGQGITLEAQQLRFAQEWANLSLYIAVGLHLVSAVILFLLGLYSIGTIGYLGGVGALLLTVLRPIVRGYTYLMQRLQQIGEQVRYPREDVLELRQRLTHLESSVEVLRKELDAVTARYHQFMEETIGQLAGLRAQIDNLQAVHRMDVERLERESQRAIAQLSEDGQFLQQVREIIRFFKSA